MAGLLDFLQAASNSAASNVSGPVDGLAWLLRKAGIDVGDPVGGSAWMERQGLTRPVKQSGASLAGETAGLLAPIAAAAKAPQIAKGLLQMGENAAAPRTLRPDQGAIVWHGSPHKFDRFDASKIGTGEGAQAYGHGLYLAESPGVAKSYQETLRPLRLRVGDEWINGSDDVAMVATSLDGATSQQAVKAQFLMDARRAQHLADTSGSKAMAQKAENARRWASMVDDVAAKMRGKPIAEELGDGHLYKVDLPDSAISRMLDWDKPLSQQAPEVRSAFESMFKDVTAGGFDLSRSPRDLAAAFYGVDLKKGQATKAMMEKYGLKQVGGNWLDRSGNVVPQTSIDRYLTKKTGKEYTNAGELYNDFSHIVGSQSDVSATLRNNGVPGIRYLDGGSRGAGTGTSNFVVFPGEESLLTILERNGIPLR